MTGWKNGWIGVTAHTLENLPWEESEGLPAEAAREPQAQRPQAWKVQGGRKLGDAQHCVGQLKSLQSS